MSQTQAKYCTTTWKISVHTEKLIESKNRSLKATYLIDLRIFQYLSAISNANKSTSPPPMTFIEGVSKLRNRSEAIRGRHMIRKLRTFLCSFFKGPTRRRRRRSTAGFSPCPVDTMGPRSKRSLLTTSSILPSRDKYICQCHFV